MYEGIKSPRHSEETETPKRQNPLENISLFHLNGMLEGVQKANEENERVVNPADFIKEVNPKGGVYEIADVMRDNERLETIEKNFTNGKNECGETVSQLEKLRILAELFECSLPVLVEKLGLLGDLAVCTLTTKFDDVMNGIDAWVDFRGSQKDDTLGLAVDLTISEGSIGRKLEKIKEKLDNGSLAEIKYYKSEDGEYLGSRKNIVPLIVTASPETALKIISGIYFEKREDSEENIFNSQCLEEMILQLRSFCEYSEKLERGLKKEGKNNISYHIKRDLEIIEKISSEKNKDLSEEEIKERRSRYDDNFRELRGCLESIFNKEKTPV